MARMAKLEEIQWNKLDTVVMWSSVLLDRWSPLQPCLAKPHQPIHCSGKPNRSIFNPASNTSLPAVIDQSEPSTAKKQEDIFSYTFRSTDPVDRTGLVHSSVHHTVTAGWCLDFQIRPFCTSGINIKNCMNGKTRLFSVGNTKQHLLDSRFTSVCGAETQRKLITGWSDDQS